MSSGVSLGGSDMMDGGCSDGRWPIACVLLNCSFLQATQLMAAVKEAYRSK
jgi:hypothetical protein